MGEYDKINAELDQYGGYSIEAFFALGRKVMKDFVLPEFVDGLVLAYVPRVFIAVWNEEDKIIQTFGALLPDTSNMKEVIKALREMGQALANDEKLLLSYFTVMVLESVIDDKKAAMGLTLHGMCITGHQTAYVVQLDKMDGSFYLHDGPILSFEDMNVEFSFGKTLLESYKAHLTGEIISRNINKFVVPRYGNSKRPSVLH